MNSMEPDTADNLTDAELDRMIEEAQARYRKKHTRQIRIEVVPVEYQP